MKLKNLRVPFLSEIELGNAPPKELIAKNFKIDYEQYREPMDLTDFFKKGKQYLETTKKKIEDLKNNVLDNLNNYFFFNLIIRWKKDDMKVIMKCSIWRSFKISSQTLD